MIRATVALHRNRNDRKDDGVRQSLGADGGGRGGRGGRGVVEAGGLTRGNNEAGEGSRESRGVVRKDKRVVDFVSATARARQGKAGRGCLKLDAPRFEINDLARLQMKFDPRYQHPPPPPPPTIHRKLHPSHFHQRSGAAAVAGGEGGEALSEGV